MAIEVGALTLAIGADYRQAVSALNKVDRIASQTGQNQLDRTLRIRNAVLSRIDAYRREEQALSRLTAVKGDPKAEAADIRRAQDAYESAVRARYRADNGLQRARIANVKAMAAEQDKLAEAIGRSDAARAAITRREKATRDAALRQQGEHIARVQAAEKAAYTENEKRIAAANQQNADYQTARRRAAAAQAQQQAGHIARVQAAERAAYAEDRSRTIARQTNEATRIRAVQRAEILAHAENDRRNAAAARNAQRRASQTAAAQARAARAARTRRETGAGLGFSSFGLSGAFVTAAALREATLLTNEYQRLNQRLLTVSRSQGEANLIFGELGQVAQNARVGITDMSELYAKLRISNEKVGLSTRETLQVTEAFANALRASGATGQAASSAMLQFGQAMSKGKLDGDEFRTVAETNAVAMIYLAKHLGVTQGELLKMREEGKLTAKEMAAALIKYSKDIETLANKGPLTMAQAMQQLRNATIIAIGGSQDIKTAANNIAQALVRVASFVQDNGPLITGFAKVALAIGGVTLAVNVLRGSMALLARNPGLLALQALVTALVLLNGRENKKWEIDRSSVENAKTVEQANKAALDYAQRLNDVSAQIRKEEEARAALLRQQESAGLPGFMRGSGAISDDRLTRLRKQQKDLTDLVTESAERADALRRMDEKPVVPDATGDTDPGKAKRELDQYIQSVLRLLAAGQATEKEFNRLNVILAAQRKILETSTNTSDRADALQRIQDITEGLRGFYFTADMAEGAGSRIAELVNNLDLLFGAMSPADLVTVVDRVREMAAEVDRLTIGTREHTEALQELRKAQDALAGSNPFELPEAPIDDYTRRMEEFVERTRSELWSLRAAFDDFPKDAATDLFTGLFEGVGEQITSGGTALRDALFGVVGNIFSQFGRFMIRYGVLTSKLFAAMVANPLASGVVAIAVGGAMVALGSAMSAATRGGGKGGGGFTSGASIGGLGIGGAAQTASTYIFGATRNPLGSGRVAEARDGVVVNQTIIGVNDPVAQRQIAEMTRLAARRGVRTQ